MGYNIGLRLRYKLYYMLQYIIIICQRRRTGRNRARNYIPSGWQVSVGMGRKAFRKRIKIAAGCAPPKSLGCAMMCDTACPGVPRPFTRPDLLYIYTKISKMKFSLRRFLLPLHSIHTNFCAYLRLRPARLK